MVTQGFEQTLEWHLTLHASLSNKRGIYLIPYEADATLSTLQSPIDKTIATPFLWRTLYP